MSVYLLNLKMKTKNIPQNQINQSNIGYCSDYDEDCKEIKYPSVCFLGLPFETPCCGKIIHFELADGLCKEMEIRRNETTNKNRSK
jgi:hypothetical protein